MVVECLVILGILIAMSVIFLRTRKEHAVLPIPLMVLPAMYILTRMFPGGLSSFIPPNDFLIAIGIGLIALLISGVLMGLFSSRLKNKANKITYTITCMLFNLALAIILIQHYYIPQ